MPLSSGARLGPYEILTAIGAGGMGEVYRARDTKLGREVALKILPESFVNDPERVARFHREAQLLASLNHPNIAHIHGLEDSNGVCGLVMELVEGPTLADRLALGAMPLDEALSIAKQIAEALEAAHEQGIVHRDLKPANIKVREDGTVKVLDFGLAKALDPVASSITGLTHSPTLTLQATQAGVILGTAAYMSPEQARGRAVNRRTDIWAFGCILFEMLTGARAFDGEDVAETIGAVIHKEPAWSKLPAEAPAVVRTVLQRCLEKDVKQRIRDIGDVQLALNGAFESSATGQAPVALPAKPSALRAISIAVVSACLAAVIAAAAAWALKPQASLPVTRSRFVLPEGQQFLNGARQWLDVSPDGMQVVYTASGRLFLRSLSELDSRPLIGGASSIPSVIGISVSSPIFSPDGHAIAYFEGTTLKRLATGGGPPVTLGEADPPWGMSWSDAGIVFGQGSKGIVRISDKGGAPEQIVRVESTEVAAHPRMLPGKQVVLFSLASTQAPGPDLWDKARIVAQRLDTGERKTIIETGSNARYLPTGHLLYVVAGTLFAVPFEYQRLQVTGAAVPVEQNVRRSQSVTVPAGTSQYAVTEGGTLVFVPGPGLGSERGRIVSMSRRGGTTPLPLPPNAYGALRVSPDGQRLLFDTDDGREAIIWIYDLAGTSQPRRLTFGGRSRFPVWSADGQRVLFQSDRDGSLGLYLQRADNSGAVERLTTPEPGTAHVPESWSPTEDRFSFSEVRGGSASLWTFSVRDKHASRFGDAQSTVPFNSEFSPDGRWIAYTLRPGNSANVFVEPFPATGAKYQITTNNGHHPVWLPGGKELSYRIGDSNQVVVAVRTTPGFSLGNPSSAIAGGLPTVRGARSFDITRDGGAFLAVAPVSDAGGGTTPVQEIRIVQNWLEELKRLLPTK